jgi:5-methylcytosine-specific restriction endonuclease McrA
MSRDSYNDDWDEISLAVKKEHDFRCDNCHRREGIDGVIVGVHHRDRTKRNDSPDNLMCLCWSCHYAIHRSNSEFVLEQIRRCVEAKLG